MLIGPEYDKNGNFASFLVLIDINFFDFFDVPPSRGRGLLIPAQNSQKGFDITTDRC